MRVLSMPGHRSEKKATEGADRCRNRSRRRSPVTATNAELLIQPAMRQSRLSAAINDTSNANAPQALIARGACDRASTRLFTPYCVPVAQITAASTAQTIRKWEIGRRRAYDKMKANGRFT